MILDLLNRKIKEMKELRRLEAIKANKAQQDATDVKYQSYINDVHKTIEAVHFANDVLHFGISAELKSQIEGLLLQNQEITKSGFADKDVLSSAQTSFKSLNTGLKKEWNNLFSNITATTISTLKVISAIDNSKVSQCILDIDSAKSWSDEKAVLKKLRAALDDASNLINSLNLDEGIIAFLTKMNTGRATLSDLDETVLRWIKQGELESRIKLTFK